MRAHRSSAVSSMCAADCGRPSSPRRAPPVQRDRQAIWTGSGAANVARSHRRAWPTASPSRRPRSSAARCSSRTWRAGTSLGGCSLILTVARRVAQLFVVITPRVQVVPHDHRLPRPGGVPPAAGAAPGDRASSSTSRSGSSSATPGTSRPSTSRTTRSTCSPRGRPRTSCSTRRSLIRRRAGAHGRGLGGRRASSSSRLNHVVLA